MKCHLFLLIAFPLKSKVKAYKESIIINSFSFFSYNFDSGNLSDNIKVQLVVTLFSDLVDISKFDSEKLLRFVLTICKNHRPQSYHNWDHAFSVTHFMYLLIKGAPHLFSQIEV